MLNLHESDEIRSEEIEELWARLDFQTDLIGSCHSDTIDVVQKLAIALSRRGDFGRAAGLLDRALGLAASSLGNEHPLRIALLGTLGELMFEQGHLEQAGRILR